MRQRKETWLLDRKHGETLAEYLQRTGITPDEHQRMKQRYWVNWHRRRRLKLKDHVHYCKPHHRQKWYPEHYWAHKDTPLCYYYDDDEATWSNLYKQCEEHRRIMKYPRKPKFPRPVKFPRL